MNAMNKEEVRVIVEKVAVAITVIIFLLIPVFAVRFTIASNNFEKDCKDRVGVYVRAKNDLLC